jgi:hypothetical protein
MRAKIKYQCTKCLSIKEEESYYNNKKLDTLNDWCEKCEELTYKPVKLDTTLTTKRYGREQSLNCPNGCSELASTKASDICFGDISRDVVIVYCPICKYEEDCFTL